MQTVDIKKRCACGRSTTYPLCDGSHGKEGWHCSAVTTAPVETAFLGGPHLVNLADRLAHGLDGISVNAASAPVRAKALFVLSDGSDVQWLQERMQEVDSQQTRIIGIGIELHTMRWAFPTHNCVTIKDENATTLWTNVVGAIRADPVPLPVQPDHRPRVFVSHAVADEGHLFPVLQTLRRVYGLELFVCADSIPAGKAWQEEIRRQVSQCDLFVLISSEAVMHSTYCGFEVGMATALDKSVRVVCLEDDVTPAYLTHLQGVSIPRLLVRKPWLMPREALLDAMLEVIQPCLTDAGQQ